MSNRGAAQSVARTWENPHIVLRQRRRRLSRPRPQCSTQVCGWMPLGLSLDLGGVHSCLVVGLGVATLPHDARGMAPVAKQIADGRHLPETTIASVVALAVFVHRCGGKPAVLVIFAELPASRFRVHPPRPLRVPMHFSFLGGSLDARIALRCRGGGSMGMETATTSRSYTLGLTP